MTSPVTMSAATARKRNAQLIEVVNLGDGGSEGLEQQVDLLSLHEPGRELHLAVVADAGRGPHEIEIVVALATEGTILAADAIVGGVRPSRSQ
jgi:hypothetical protein